MSQLRQSMKLPTFKTLKVQKPGEKKEDSNDKINIMINNSNSNNANQKIKNQIEFFQTPNKNQQESANYLQIQNQSIENQSVAMKILNSSNEQDNECETDKISTFQAQNMKVENNQYLQVANMPTWSMKKKSIRVAQSPSIEGNKITKEQNEYIENQVQDRLMKIFSNFQDNQLETDLDTQSNFTSGTRKTRQRLNTKKLVIQGKNEDDAEDLQKGTQYEGDYLQLYRFPKIQNENNELMKRDLDAYLQKNPLIQPVLKRFLFKLKQLTIFRLIGQITDHQFKLLDDKSNYYTELDFQITEDINYKQKIQKKFTEFKTILYSIFNLVLGIFYLIPLFDPYNILRLSWDFFMMIIYVFQIFYIPLELGVGIQIPYLFRILIWVFLLIDILISLNTAYYDKGEVINDRKLVLKNYMRNQLIIDLTCIMAITSCQIFYDPMTSLKTPDELIMQDLFNQILKLLFLGQIYNFIIIFNKLVELLSLNRYQGIIDLVSMMFTALLMTHIFACIFHFIGVHQRSLKKDNWIDYRKIGGDAPEIRYLHAFYWSAVTTMTVGYGDVIPQNSLEILFATFSVLVGCGIFAYYINKIGIILQSMNQKNVRYQEQYLILQNYMSKRNVTTGTQIKIFNYLLYASKVEQALLDEQAKEIIQGIPESIRNVLIDETHKNIIERWPVFMQNFNQKIIDGMKSVIKEVRYGPNDCIITQGAYNDDYSIFLVLKGSLEMCYTSSDEENKIVTSIKIKKLYENDVFGELSFFTGCPREITVKSLDYCQLAVVKRQDFINLLKQNQEDSDYQVFCMIKDRMIFSNEFSDINLRCMVCQLKNHLSKDCPVIHYIPDKEFIIKRHTFPQDQARFQNFQRKNLKNSYVQKYLEISDKRKKIKQNSLKIFNMVNVTLQEFQNEIKIEENQQLDKSQLSNNDSADDDGSSLFSEDSDIEKNQKAQQSRTEIKKQQSRVSVKIKSQQEHQDGGKKKSIFSKNGQNFLENQILKQNQNEIKEEQKIMKRGESAEIEMQNQQLQKRFNDKNLMISQIMNFQQTIQQQNQKETINSERNKQVSSLNNPQKINNIVPFTDSIQCIQDDNRGELQIHGNDNEFFIKFGDSQNTDSLTQFSNYFPMSNFSTVIEYYMKNKIKRRVINKLYQKLVQYFFNVNRRYKMVESTRAKRKKQLQKSSSDENKNSSEEEDDDDDVFRKKQQRELQKTGSPLKNEKNKVINLLMHQLKNTNSKNGIDSPIRQGPKSSTLLLLESSL